MSIDEESELVDVLRKQNRIRRKSEKRLRLLLSAARQDTDFLFEDLGEVLEESVTAKAALERLHTEAKLGCDPTDYEQIVNKCLELIFQYST